MKIYLPFIFLFLIAKMDVYAQYPPNQPQQDCIHATPVCDAIVYEPNSYRGGGSIKSEIDSSMSCLGRGERHGAWYQIHILKGGKLCFTITPDSSQQDLDFGVFNLTNATCEDIKTDSELEVACNFITNAGPCNGVTGADGATAGICGFQHLPCLTVKTGESYLLYVSSYNLFDGGYTIDFSASTAVLFDNKAIKASAKVVMPNLNQIEVTFSKPMTCAQLNLTEFSLVGVSTLYSLDQLSSDDCEAGSDYEPTVVLDVQPAIDLNELGNLELVIADSLDEMCGKTTLTLSTLVGIDFDIKSQPSTDSICSNEPFSLSTNIPTNTNLQIRWEPGTVNAPTYQPGPGVSDTFRALVFANNGIPLGFSRKEFEILEAPEIFVGKDTSLCGPDTLQLRASGDYQGIVWNNNATEHDILVNIGGIYWAEARNDNGCRARDSVRVNFVDVPNTGFTVNATGNQYTFLANCQDCSGYQWKLSNGATGMGSSYTYVFSQPGNVSVKLIVANPCGSDSSSQVINVVLSAEEEIESQIELYPNPVSNVLFVRSEHLSTSSLALYNAVGEVVLQEEIGPHSLKEIPVKGLSAGLYFCKISSKEGGFIRKIWIRP